MPLGPLSGDSDGIANRVQKSPATLLRKLRRENQRLKTENEILLKASAFFASKQL